MSISVSIMQGGVNNHPTTSEEANGIATDFVSEGIVGAYTNTSGVAPATGAFAVNAQGTPDMTVAVSAGVAYVTGTPSSQNSQTFRVKSGASENVTIAANSSGSTKYDWVYIKLDATLLNAPTLAGTTTATLVTSRSTSSTADDGTPPTYGYPIAVVTVANGASSITNGTIADVRVNSTTVVDGTLSAAKSTPETNIETRYSETVFDHVASGCVLTGTGYGSTLGWSLTSGVVYISGKRYTVASATGTVTATKDTYFDVLAPTTGTVATLVSTGGNIVTVNAASPTLASSSIRIGIIQSGANIASVAAINQGQETKVLPIASSIPYAVTDSLGNLICPRDPQRKILGYRQLLASVTTTSTTQQTVVSVPVIVPSNRKITITAYADSFGSTSGTNVSVAKLWDGAVVSGTQLTQTNSLSGSVTNNPTTATLSYITTPSASSKTYTLGLNINISGTASWGVVSSPLYLKVELV